MLHLLADRRLVSQKIKLSDWLIQEILFPYWIVRTALTLLLCTVKRKTPNLTGFSLHKPRSEPIKEPSLAKKFYVFVKRTLNGGLR